MSLPEQNNIEQHIVRKNKQAIAKTSARASSGAGMLSCA